ncbi:hypothetical protein H6G89_32795 [Oscillatoria sp. FACHB-1407]|uniref:hypothetical protein n=1 Tax=Oscillatoria sp. FACHB-1407 TaxID=2692847 RepID=UPI0016822691|nr:hypothetical protein [Oscillatoria sp. FACHB-1407]MBD2465769.1 hypothetical protein [Oscillatoria sp. FACHB-1407]
MELFLYHQLGTQSKRCMRRLKRPGGHPYTYNPKGNLLERLARDNGMSIEEVRNRLLLERKELLRHGE